VLGKQRQPLNRESRVDRCYRSSRIFDANRSILRSTSTINCRAEKTPAERKNHFCISKKYGRFPFELLPRP